MKKFFVITFVVFIIALTAIFSMVSNSNIITGNAVLKLAQHSSNFYFLLGSFILIAATSAYFYSAKKYGPA